MSQFTDYALLSDGERNSVVLGDGRALMDSAEWLQQKGRSTERADQESKAYAIIAEKLYLEGELTVREICKQRSNSKGTFYNYLR